MRRVLAIVVILAAAAIALGVQTGGSPSDLIKGDCHIMGDLTVDGSISGPGSLAFPSFSLATGVASAGTYYLAGGYIAPAAEAVLNQGAATQTWGETNKSYAMHALIVAKEAGTATGGSGAVKIVVSGISITDVGVRTAADTETVVADITTLATHAYAETAKKWLGQITYTLDVGATGHTAYAASFNYGYAKYADFGNRAYSVTDTQCNWLGGGNETNLGIRFLHHSASAWTYSAAAFVPGGTVITDLDVDHGTDDEFDVGEYGNFKRAGLSVPVAGDLAEGVVIEITTEVNNSLRFMNCQIGVTF